MKCLPGHKKLDERSNGQKSVMTPYIGDLGPGLGCCVDEEKEGGGGRRRIFKWHTPSLTRTYCTLLQQQFFLFFILLLMQK